MMKVAGALLLLCAAFSCADSRVQARRGLVGSTSLASANHPYLFLSVPRSRSGAVVQGFEVVESDDDDDDSDVVAHVVDDDEPIDDDENDEEYEKPTSRRVVSVLDDNEEDDAADDDDDQMVDDEQLNVQTVSAKRPTNMQLVMKNAKPTQMMVSREHAGAIMVPDGIIEIQGQSVIDEKTGKAALLVPRAALEAIPDGSVVALMERSVDESEEERANRVIVRRRRKGSRRNVKRRGSNTRRRRRRGSNKIRRGNSNNGVRVLYRGGNNRRRGVRRGSRPVVNQG